MKNIHIPSACESIKKHLISDIKSILPGIFLCVLFLTVMTAAAGKVCPSRLLFGIPCPGCGLTRAAFLLVQRDLHGSLLCNPFLLPLLAGGLVFLFEHYLLERKARIFTLYISICIVLMIIVYIIRMKYWFPNRAPMTYEPENLLRLLLTARNF